MVRALVVAMMVAGCLDAPTPASPPVIVARPTAQDGLVRAPDMGDAPVDVCAAAAELPADDLCSLVCDPDALKARMLDNGTPAGTCYEMRCALPGLTVTVGVCLPPPPA